MGSYDVIVVGAGNAAFSAALAAEENEAKVLVLERAPEGRIGGNSAFHRRRVPSCYVAWRISPADAGSYERRSRSSDFGTYTSDQFFDDMFRVTRYRTRDLCERLVTKSYEIALWLRRRACASSRSGAGRPTRSTENSSSGAGSTVEAWGGGPGLVEQQVNIARKPASRSVTTHAHLSLIDEGHAVTGVRVKQKGEIFDRGKFGRARHRRVRIQSRMADAVLGPGWELAKVRGTRFNTWRRHQDGDGHRCRRLWQLVGMPRGRLGL